MSETPPAGWYPDPENDSQQRYWDGSQWTEHRAPLAPQPPASPTPTWSTGGGYGQTGYGQTGYGQTGYGAPPQRVDPWLWQSIVATVLCCLPLGIAGIVNAAGANSAMSAGNWAEAQRKADLAKKFTLASVGIGVGIVVLYVVVIAIAGSQGGF